MREPTTGYTPGSPPRFGDGNIRIWNKDGDQPRSANSISSYGNLVMDGAYYTAEHLGFTDTERTITLYVEGHSLGSNVIIVSMDYNDSGHKVHVEDAVKYTVIQQEFAVLVDTNRDNTINDLDEIGKEVWTNGNGAIILYNGDDDDGNHLPDYMDNDINGMYDLFDIGQLRVTRPDQPLDSGNWSVVMTLAPTYNEDAYWTNNYLPEERVRIFLPTYQSISGDLYCQAGDVGILGGMIKDASGGYVTTGPCTITFTSSPVDPLLDISIFDNMGSTYFGLEGLIPGAPVRIITQLYCGIDLIKEDIVEVKVTPFIAFSHESEVETSHEYGPTVFVSDFGNENLDLRTNLSTEYGSL